MRCLFAPAVLCLLSLSPQSSLWADDPVMEKTVTVFPVPITPSEHISTSIPRRIAEVIGLGLERAGMEQVKIGEMSFTPPATEDISEVAKAFGHFVADQKLDSHYAVFVQIFGRPGVGISEIRTIAVDAKGAVVLSNDARQQALSQVTPTPKDPITASLFVVNQLVQTWKLANPMRKDAPQGPMAELMRKRSGLPPQEQLDAMKKRLQDDKAKLPSATVAVYPIHLWNGSDEACTAKLVKLLNERRLCQAEVTDIQPRLDVQGDPNEQKVLWDTARQFREFLRHNPPQAEYALLADYGLSPHADGQELANHVHLILCDRAGQWVLVDFQNSKQADFQRIEPKTCAECNRLAVERLTRLLSK